MEAAAPVPAVAGSVGCPDSGQLGQDVAAREDQQVLALDGDLGPAVLRVDDLVADSTGELIPLDIAVGDKVVYSKYGGTEITIDGEDLLILTSRDVLAKVK